MMVRTYVRRYLLVVANPLVDCWLNGPPGASQLFSLLGKSWRIKFGRIDILW